MDENIFIPEEKFLQIGKRRFSVWISAERALKATALFNKLNQKGSEERKSITTDYDFYIAMLDVAFLLIRQDFRIKNVVDWLKRQLLSKKYILKHMDIKQLASFIDDALEPIIGTKKKELDRQERMAEAFMILVDKTSPEVLAKLLQKSLPGADIQKVM